MALRKWTRADRIALSELIESYQETGRLDVNPLPVPLDVEVATFNTAAGYEEGKGRTGKAIRNQIKQAIQNHRLSSSSVASKSLRDSVNCFRTKQERDAYVKAASMFENANGDSPGKRPRCESEDESDEEESDVVRSLKKRLREQERKITELTRERESEGLRVCRRVMASESAEELDKEEAMCLSLMFFGSHGRYVSDGGAKELFDVCDLVPYVGAGVDSIKKAIDFLNGENNVFFERCRTVMQWDGTVFVKFPIRTIGDVESSFMCSRDFRDMLGTLQTIPVSVGDSNTLEADFDVSHVILAYRIVSKALDRLTSFPESKGCVCAAAFDMPRLKRAGWTTVIPQTVLLCRGLVGM
tara:strand:+ start:982 stop:2049 length:1068 start_codon:yes stop_codon:yes gene_type:complete